MQGPTQSSKDSFLGGWEPSAGEQVRAPTSQQIEKAKDVLEKLVFP